MIFSYCEKDQCYSAESGDILFSCEKLGPVLEIYADRLAGIYKEKLPFIAEYIVKNTDFIEVYGRLSEEEFLCMLETMPIPWVFIREDDSGTIAYCDSDYVIELFFTGDFEKMSDLSIDS